MSEYQNFNQQQLLICSIAGLQEYDDTKDKGSPHSGASYVQETGNAYEKNNFKEQDGQYHGYVNIPGGGAQLRIQDLGTTIEAAEVENITIIWIAPHPLSGESSRSNQKFVVGWYRNATVCRYPRDNKKKQRMYTKTQDGHLILPDNRRLWFPLSIRSLRYGCNLKGKIAKDFLKELDNLMGQNPLVPLPQESGQESHRAGSGRQLDDETRKKIERAAVACVTKHYEHQGYTVKSVETDNIGWDLEAQKNDSLDVLIEVKGTQGTKIDCELTPNEYDQKEIENFRLAVVTSALEKKSCLRIFQFLPGKKEWICQYGKSVKVYEKPRIGARIYE